MSGGLPPKCTEEEFVNLWNTYGPAETARHLSVTERAVYKRKNYLAQFHQFRKLGENLKPWPGRVNIELRNGTVLIGSDFHIWPGNASVCLRAFKKFIADLKPDAIVLNGDVMDFPRISRHPQNWESAPDVHEELEAAQDHLNDMVTAAKRGSKKIWTRGNHDQRFEQLFANSAPNMKKVKGVHLYDHFAIWDRAMSCFINYGKPSATMVKHRLAGGIHATYNNVKRAGTSIVTGHLHAQNVCAVSDYRDHDLFGVDTGCVAEKNHKAFSYTEDSPVNWREGFAVLEYRDWHLMRPQLVSRWDDNYVEYCGKVVRV
jgi:hypothetical protein